MRLTHLTLTQFRKFQSLSLEIPQHQLVCFVGPNTIGKTNILEAMYFLSFVKSFRTNRVKDVLQWDQGFFRIEGQFEDKNRSRNFDVRVAFHPKKGRKYLINDVEYSYGEYVGQSNVVFFSPDDINMLLIAPGNRRKYVDMLLAQSSPVYLHHLVQYQKLLKQRNALLKRIKRREASKDELSAWDQPLSEHMAHIMQERDRLMEQLAEPLSKLYRDISGTEGQFELLYEPSMQLEEYTPSDIYAGLQSSLDKDLLFESTSKGAHRDDILFQCENRGITTYASRGDTRSMVLALKLAEIGYIEEHTGRSPLLLLDDVFSELDDKRQEQLLSHIPSHIQTFITTTSEEIGTGAWKGKDLGFVHVEDLLN